MLRKPIHPLQVVRKAWKKSRLELGRILGISEGHVKKIEQWKRDIPDELGLRIMLRLGLERESIQRSILQPGRPKSLIDSMTAAYTVCTVDNKTLQIPDGLENTSKEFDAVKKIKDPGEKLRRSIELWQKIVPHWDLSLIRPALRSKLEVLLEAAEREKKFLQISMALDLWIENVIQEFQLRTTVKAVSISRGVKWTTFMDMIRDSFQLIKPPPDGHRYNAEWKFYFLPDRVKQSLLKRSKRSK
jgi:hypothetical protein